MSRPYDLCVAYRIYPLISKTPAAFADDKLRLAELCLRSFRDALGDLRVKIYVILDNCPQEYEKLFERYFDEDTLVEMPLKGAGNRETFGLQLKLLCEQEFSDLVYFAEDDYYYRPDALKAMVAFMRSEKEADFVTPYDHTDYYRTEFHDGSYRIKFSGGRHWRTAMSTCLTFMSRREALTEARTAVGSYTRGNSDLGLWLSLTKQKLYHRGSGFAWRYGWQHILFGRRMSLWVPVPSMATHMEKEFLAPTMDSIDFEGSGKR